MNFAIAGVFIASCLSFITALSLIFGKRLNIQYRLSAIKDMYKDNTNFLDKKSIPFKERVIAPVLNRISEIVRRVTPKGYTEELERKLRAADYPLGLRVNGWIVLQIFLNVVLPCLLLLLVSRSQQTMMNKLLLVSVFVIICMLLPKVMLKNRIRSRLKSMELELPDILDLLVVSVEAGLSFDSSMAKVVEKSKGQLTREFAVVLNEMELGKTRREALTAMSQRCDTQVISTFITSIIQAEQLGVSMGKILRVQADQLRDKRRQTAREHAMKASVKMLLPMVLFIFPTIFIVILGPAVIQIMGSGMFK